LAEEREVIGLMQRINESTDTDLKAIERIIAEVWAERK